MICYHEGFIIATSDQCDQVERLSVQELAIYKVENLPDITEICQSRVKTVPSAKLTLKICQRLETLCQSGNISPNLVTLIASQI